MGYGNSSRISSIAATTHLAALFFNARLTVQPVKTSVTVSVNAYWPLALLPQWATVSIATKPGCQSMSGIRDMIGIASVYWFRRDLVVDFPSGYIESLNGAKC